MKNKNYMVLIIFILVIYLSSSITLFGIQLQKHFTFNVPISIETQNDCIESVKVEVTVSKIRAGINGFAVERNIIARANKVYDIRVGRNSFRANISFSADSHKNPNDAKGWYVTLFFKKKGDRGYLSSSSFKIRMRNCNCIIDSSNPNRSWTEGNF